MRLMRTVSAAACLVGYASVTLAHETKLPQKFEDLSLAEVSPNVYVAHGIQALPNSDNKGFMSNTGVVITDAGVVIVDSGGSAAVARAILKKVRELTPKPVIAVFNSHVHGDHWLGNAAIHEAYPNARIIAHEKAIRRLKEGEAVNWTGIFARLTEKTAEEIRAVLPNEAVNGGETIKIGASEFTLHHTGHAHTDGDIMIELPGKRLLFTGDIVEYGRAVSSDVPQDFDAKGQIAAIEDALKLPVDIYVPGHGVSGDRQIPEAALRFLKVLYDSVKRSYDAGLQDYEMRDKVAKDLSEFSSWANFDQLGKLISHTYLQIEKVDFQ